jgi:hypothetical protein
VTVRYVQNSYRIDVEQTNTLKGNKATEPKPSFYAFCDKVSKEMYQFFLCERDVKGRSGKLYSGINILFLSLSLSVSSCRVAEEG